jgi:hypothetical protein
MTTRIPATEYACTHLPEHGVSVAMYKNTMWIDDEYTVRKIRDDINVDGTDFDSILFRAFLIAPNTGEYRFRVALTGYVQIAVEGQLLLTETSREEREIFTSSAQPMELVQLSLYEMTLRYAFLPQLPPTAYPVIPFLEVLWSYNNGPFEVIPVTALLHELSYSEGFPRKISIINDPSSCVEGPTTFSDLWDPDNGTIVDGSPTHDYNRNVKCTWRWEVKENKRKKFKLIVKEFNLEVSKDCHFDGVTIRIGSNANSEIGGVFCGYYPPGHVLWESVGRGLMLDFYTDGNYEFGGFQLQWIVTNENCRMCDTGPRPPDKNTR